MQNIFSRIRQFVDYKGISNNEFGREIECSSGQIAQMLTYEKNFGIDKLLKIVSKYPEISLEWLLTGDGNMLKNDAKQTVRNDDNTHPSSQNFVLNADNGSISGNKDNTNISENQTKNDFSYFLDIIKEKDNQIAKSQEQIDKLIGIIEKLNIK